MLDFASLNQHQKIALVIQLYKQGKTRRQIAEVVHMSFKDIADIIKEYTGEGKQVNKPEKSKDWKCIKHWKCHLLPSVRDIETVYTWLSSRGALYSTLSSDT